jgi:glycosyltransferase involved in cell wall biosynthesis
MATGETTTALSWSPAASRIPQVLQVLACDAVGGTETMVCKQVLHCNPDRVSYEVAILAPSGPVARVLSRGGVCVHSLASRSWVGKARSLRSVVEDGNFDVVNAYGFKATMLARIVLHRLPPGQGKRPALICGVRGLHTTEVEDMRSFKARVVALAEKWTRGYVDLWDANSPGAAEFIRSLGVPAERVRYIPNGIDLDDWPVASATRPAPPRILCVSRFVPRKRQIDLVEALAQLRDSGVEFGADFVGSGPTREKVEVAARSFGLSDSVRFHGTLGADEIRTLMEGATLFCLVSTWEGMPGAVMEAMAAGLPVIGSDVNGTDAVVVDGVTGCLVPPRAPKELAEALTDSLSDPEKLLRWAGRDANESRPTSRWTG